MTILQTLKIIISMINLKLKRAADILDNIKNKNIAVIGDVMIDKYYWGNVSRVSPEAPVPVIDLKKETYHLGGAANVVSNLKSLRANPFIFGLLGNDDNGKLFIKHSHDIGISTIGLYRDKQRPTTVKTRIIGNNQQIARLDKEVKNEIDIIGIQYIIEKLNNIEHLDAIIFEDYNKGTINNKLIEDVLYLAKIKSIPVFVDPKENNFFEYKNVELIKPNKKEASIALKRELDSNEEIINAGKILKDKLNCSNLLLTMGADGMMLFDSDNNISSVPTRARSVADVSGAGDTAIATLTAAFTAGADIYEASAMANFASGVVCEQAGIVSIKPEELLKSIEFNSVG